MTLKELTRIVVMPPSCASISKIVQPVLFIFYKSKLSSNVNAVINSGLVSIGLIYLVTKLKTLLSFKSVILSRLIISSCNSSSVREIKKGKSCQLTLLIGIQVSLLSCTIDSFPNFDYSNLIQFDKNIKYLPVMKSLIS